MNVLIWCEDRPLPEHEKTYREIYKEGIHGQLKKVLETDSDLCIHTATMQDEDQGLSDEALDWCDVLVYWGHKHWREIEDARVDYMQKRVLEGMGLVLLHSAHASKIFARLMGTRTQSLRWRENDEWQRVWTVNPAHPISKGLKGEFFTIPMDETYGEYFEIPQPDEQVFITTSQGGEVLRSGNCWYRGRGKVFYFSSGHETYPVYMQSQIQLIVRNAVKWAAGPERDTTFPTWARCAETLK